MAVTAVGQAGLRVWLLRPPSRPDVAQSQSLQTPDALVLVRSDILRRRTLL